MTRPTEDMTERSDTRAHPPPSIRHYVKALITVRMGRLGVSAAAEDTLQDVMLKLLSWARALDRRIDETEWKKMGAHIANALIVDCCRRQRVELRVRAMKRLDDYGSSASLQSHAVEVAEVRDRVISLLKALAKPGRERRLVDEILETALTEPDAIDVASLGHCIRSSDIERGLVSRESARAWACRTWSRLVTRVANRMSDSGTGE